MSFDHEIAALQTLQRPTSNPVTDPFGYYRVWGGSGWTHSKLYSPIHAGQDYSARPESVIAAPCDGWAYGEYMTGSIGSYTMFRPITPRGPSEHIALYFIHCRPTAKEWTQYQTGDPLTVHAGYGIGAPHLHYEIAVTEQFGRVLELEKILNPAHVTLRDWRLKAKEAGLPARRVLQRISDQMKAWGIQRVCYDYIVRESLPKYKRSQHYEVGNGPTWILDPERIANMEDAWAS